MKFENLVHKSLMSVSVVALMASTQAMANPTGGTVVTGDVNITGTGTNNVIINNNSSRAIVDFDSFSIDVGETTTINQITNDSAILNRVTGGDITEIFGTLESNGEVFLINPSGILVGESGLVETNGFTASTLDVDNSDFLNGGDLVFKQGVDAGNGITVHGRIRSVSGGDIFLLSREIEIGESGSISSSGGVVGLGAGEEILLKPADDGNGRIVIRAGKGKIINRGVVEGISAELHAAGGNEYALAINNTGIVRATGATKSGGRVLLTGGGTVKNTGTIKATRKVRVRSKRKIINRGTIRAATADQGGSIVFDAPDIVVETGSILDVSAALGGGRVFIGGGFQGSNTDRAGNEIDITQNAQTTVVEAGALINASATGSGDAGEIIIWADGSTEFAGELRASSSEGAGGFAEVSGRETLNIAGISVDLSGATGNGTLFLDPDDITISADTATAANVILDSDIENLLNAGTSLVIATGGTGATNSSLSTSGTSVPLLDPTGNFTSGAGGAGDIDIEAGVRINFTNDGTVENDNATLTLTAVNDINALDDIIIQNSGSIIQNLGSGTNIQQNEGGIVLNAGNDINIGSADNRTGGVAIGSEFGVTVLNAGVVAGVAGVTSELAPTITDDGTGNINIIGGDTALPVGGDGPPADANGAFAHVGFILNEFRSSGTENGDITLSAGSDITVAGGGQGNGFENGVFNFAQVGHGGATQDPADNTRHSVINSDITVNAGGDLNLTGGDDVLSSAVIGHGAFQSTAVLGAPVNVPSPTSQFRQDSLSGNIEVTANNVNLNTSFTPDTSGFEDDSVIARIGHGGTVAYNGFTQNFDEISFGEIQGDITVTASEVLTLGVVTAANTGENTYDIFSVIGHGSTAEVLSFGPANDGDDDTFTVTFDDIDGDIDVTAGEINLIASTVTQNSAGNTGNLVDNFQLAQIGHSNRVTTVAAGDAPTSTVFEITDPDAVGTGLIAGVTITNIQDGDVPPLDAAIADVAAAGADVAAAETALAEATETQTIDGEEVEVVLATVLSDAQAAVDAQEALIDDLTVARDAADQAVVDAMAADLDVDTIAFLVEAATAAQTALDDAEAVLDTTGTDDLQGELAAAEAALSTELNALTAAEAAQQDAEDDLQDVIDAIDALIAANSTSTTVPGSAGGTSNFNQNLSIVENRISGDIDVIDNDADIATGGISLTSTVAVGLTAITGDVGITRIGHASQHLVDTLAGADQGINGGNVTIAQAHILGADINVETQGVATDDQDITLTTSASAGLSSAQDNTLVAQIGHGADTFVLTGAGGANDADASNAGDGGDITILQGTVSDGGLVRDNDDDNNDDIQIINTTDITVTSSNQIIIDSDTAAALSTADRNSSEGQIGHGFRTRLVTGDGGSGDTLNGSAVDGGAGGDILVVQAVDEREFGIDNDSFDDFAQGLRGDITLTAESDGTEDAILITATDSSALSATNNNVDLSLIGHNSVIEAVSGDGGDGAGPGSGVGPDQDGSGDDVDADPDGQQTANGARGGHIDIQLGRLEQDDAALTRARTIVFGQDELRSRVANLADIGDVRETNLLANDISADRQGILGLQGVSLIEGDIVINSTGRVTLDADANNALSPSNNALTDASIGHGFQISAIAGNGGDAGSANFLATPVGDISSTVPTDLINLINLENPESDLVDPVTDSIADGEVSLFDEQQRVYERTNGAATGGNGGDVRVTTGDITDRLIADRDASGNAEISHETDADRGESSDITVNIFEILDDSDLADSLIISSEVGAGLSEGSGSDVFAGIGHRVRLFAEGGQGGDGGSTNTEFDDDGNSLFTDRAGQIDATSQGIFSDHVANDGQVTFTFNEDSAGEDGFDEEAVQAGAVGIQPNVSGGRGGDTLAANGNINGDIVVNADRRVTVDSVAGHGTETRVISGIGHSTDIVAVSQLGGTAGVLFEPPTFGATFDGGIINIGGPTTGSNDDVDVTLPVGIVLIDGNEDDEFNLEGVDEFIFGGFNDSNSSVNEDGVAITTADIENRQGSTFSSINTEFGVPSSDGTTVSAVDEDGNFIFDGEGNQIFFDIFNDEGVIFHDEEADPQFILSSVGQLVENNQTNNALFAENDDNLNRFGRVVATYDGFTDQPDGQDFFSVNGNLGADDATNRISLEVFVDVDRDGDVDFVDLDRDGRLDVIDLDRDGRHDIIDGRANFVDAAGFSLFGDDFGIPASISGSGVLDFVAVTGTTHRRVDQGTGSVALDRNLTEAFSIERVITSDDGARAFAGLDNVNDFTQIVGDFSNANGGRGGDANTIAGYSIGDITVSTGDDDLGEGTSLIVSSTIFDGIAATGGPNDLSRAAIGHSAFQISDTGGEFSDDRSGREGLSREFTAHESADGGAAENFAINGSGGRGGNASVVQGALRDVDTRLDSFNLERDHLVGNIVINSSDDTVNRVVGDAGRIDILSTTSGDADNNTSIAAIGHQTDAEAFANNVGGEAASTGGTAPTSSQTEIARGGDGGDAFLSQAQIKGDILVQTGADDNEAGPADFSLVINATRDVAIPPGGDNNLQVAQIGAGRRAVALSGDGGVGDDGQLNADGGDAGDVLIQQALVLDSNITVDLFDIENGFFGNGAQILSNVFQGSNHTVRSQIGHSSLAFGNSGDGGDGAQAESDVIEQRNQTANGGDGGDIQIDQSGYIGDIALDLGSNTVADTEALQIISSSANIFHGTDNQVHAGVGHGGGTIRHEGEVTTTGAGGDSGTRNGNFGITSEVDPNLVDTDFDFNGVGNGVTGTTVAGDTDTPFATDIGVVNDVITDVDNQITLGTTRRGGDGGDVTLNINNVGFVGGATDGSGTLIAGIGDQTNGTGDGANNRAADINGLINDFGNNDDNGADITIQLNDSFIAAQMGTALQGSAFDGFLLGSALDGFDGVVVRSIAGPGSNQNAASDFNSAQIGHHAFGDAIASDGGVGINATLSATISDGDGGDGGSAITAVGAIFGDVAVSNVGGNDGVDSLDDTADTTATNILIESIGGVVSDGIEHRAEARAGHFTTARATGGAGADASREAGAPPAFPATISAQGGDGGDALTFQGQLTGDVTLTAENSIIINTLDGVLGQNVTVAAVGHRVEGRADAQIGGFGGTSDSIGNSQSLIFIFEALREFQFRRLQSGTELAFNGLSEFEQQLVAPVTDYFENKDGELSIFLNTLIGDNLNEIAANTRDNDAIDDTDFTLADLDNVPAIANISGDDGEVRTLQSILAASGHGGNAAVIQGGVGIDGVANDELATSGDITLNALAFDENDADRGIQQISTSDALGIGYQITQIGHQAEALQAIAGDGQMVRSTNANANGIGGDGGDAIVDQYAHNGSITLNSDHEITVRADNPSLPAHQTFTYIGHRTNLGSDVDAYRPTYVARGGEGGDEQAVPFADARNGNGGDVFISQRGVISGTQRETGNDTIARYDTEIQLLALEDSVNDTSIIIESLAPGLAAPDVEVHIGHDINIFSARAGDAGSQAALTGPEGASQGLLESNGGDIFVLQSDLGADIDIVGRDEVQITAESTLGNEARLVIGHERVVGDVEDNIGDTATNTITAGIGFDAFTEQVNNTALSSIDAAAQGIIEDADSGRIDIALGQITDSFEFGAEGDNDRLITITSLTENVTINATSSLSSVADIDIGNLQSVFALTQEAGQFIGVPFTQTAGDVGGITIARDTIDGDILIQALDADRNSTVAEGLEDIGRIVSITADAATGSTSDLDIGHQTTFVATTGGDGTEGGIGTGFGESRTDLFETNLQAFVDLIDPTTVVDSIDGQATFGDAQNAVEDIANIERALQIIIDEYGDRFPADDGFDELLVGENVVKAPDDLLFSDLGELNQALANIRAALTAAENALNNVSVGEETTRSVEQRVSDVQDAAQIAINNATEVQGILSSGVVPEAGSLFADPSEGGDIRYQDVTLADLSITTQRTIASVAGTDLVVNGETVADTGTVSGNVDILSGRVASGIDVTTVANNDAVIASNFGGEGFTAADDLDDSVVLIRSTANDAQEAAINIGHTRSATNNSSTGGGETDGGPDDGGVAGNGGDIEISNVTSGDVTVQAEEVVVRATGAGGISDVQLLHNTTVINDAGQSDITSLVGRGGNITNNTQVSGGVTINAEQLSSDIDEQDRTLLADGFADSFIQLGHRVIDENRSQSDETIVGTGDGEASLGSNRGGTVISSQTVEGDASGDLVTITLDAAGDGNSSDLIIETGGDGIADIRLGSGDREANDGIVNIATSGVDDLDDGGEVSATQVVSGDINLSQIEDLEINALGAGTKSIFLGHEASQDAQSGEVNGGTTQFGESVVASQALSGEINIQTTSSFRAQVAAANGGELQIGHDASQFAGSADDSANPSNLEDLNEDGIADNPAEGEGQGPSDGAASDNFDNPDVLATQTVDATISIVTGEITLENLGSAERLLVGHEALQELAVDGNIADNFDGTNADVTGTSVANGSSGHVVATSIINGDGSDIIFTATGVATSNDTAAGADGGIDPVNGIEGDIQIVASAAADIQVGHRSTSQAGDGPIVAEGQFNTLQAIGSPTLNEEGTEVEDTSGSVIQFTAVQDIIVSSATGETQVGHFITETSDLVASPVNVDDDATTGLGEGDSELRQIVGSDIVFGDNTNQGNGGVGAGGAGNNLIIETATGRTLIGHQSPDDNAFQVEGAARSVTVQLLDGDITVEAGTDEGVDAPDGTVIASAADARADETGLGDDLLILSGGGVSRIGHNIAGGLDGGDNETQVGAGDISVRAGGDLHVLGGAIGHENYDIADIAPSITNATPESLASGTPIRNRLRGNTTIGAGQNSAPEDSTLIADILVFDGSTNPVVINSGFGGVGEADVDGELRFFLPAQEGLTITAPVTFNDSDSNGDAVPDRVSSPENVFENEDGFDHENPFAFFSETQEFSDEFRGLGNFNFFFESDVAGTLDDQFTPDIFTTDNPIYISFSNGGSDTSGNGVNTEGLSEAVGTGSQDLVCEEGASHEECTLRIVSPRTEFGSDTNFGGVAGGNISSPNNFEGERQPGPVAGEDSAVGETAASSFGSSLILSYNVLKPTNSHETVFGTVVNDQLYISKAEKKTQSSNEENNSSNLKKAVLDDRNIRIEPPLEEVSSTFNSSKYHLLTKYAFGEYVAGANISQTKLDMHYPNAFSTSSSYLVFKSIEGIR